MDLIGIMRMVDTPSSGKHDFNYLCSWFDIVHSVPLGFLCGIVHIDFLPFHNVHPMSLIGPYLFMVWFWLVVSRDSALVLVWWLCRQNQCSTFMIWPCS